VTYDEKIQADYNQRVEKVRPILEAAVKAVEDALLAKGVPIIRSEDNRQFPELDICKHNSYIRLGVLEQRDGSYSFGGGVRTAIFYLSARAGYHRRSFPLRKDGTFSIDKIVAYLAEGWAAHLRKEAADDQADVVEKSSKKLFKELAEKYGVAVKDAETPFGDRRFHLCPGDGVTVEVVQSGDPATPQVAVKLYGSFTKDKATAIIDALRGILEVRE
jgi:hypothetical protein